MNNEQLTLAAHTVIDLAGFFDDLKAQVLEIYNPQAISRQGYITPSREIQLRHIQVAYWKARAALFELISEIRNDVGSPDHVRWEEFLVGLAAASILVDAARFLREMFHPVTVVRRKLDEPDPVHGIQPRMYDEVQKSLTSPYHAWHLWQATRYYDLHRLQLVSAAAGTQLAPLVEIIDRLRERLRPSLWTYVQTRFRVRGRRAVRRLGRDVLGRALYGVQEALGRGLAEVRLRPAHAPSLPKEIRAQLVQLLRPGDVLVVRKDFAITNYFLPGHWPHVALFLGCPSRLVQSELASHPHVAPRLQTIASVTPQTAVLAPDPRNTWADGEDHPCVLEAMKDGVRIRSVNSPFNSDSVVVIRPMLSESLVSAAIAQALMHEGKPYDFDFDFCASHRMVCTEVVYRAFEGVAGVQFELRRHAGRFALSAGDLLRMALAGRHFEVVAAFSKPHAATVQTGPAAKRIVYQVEGGRQEGCSAKSQQ